MPYTTAQLRQMIIAEAQRQGVDPRLALAVATQESWLNPNAVGDNGRSLGLFQLQPAAARDAGIDPSRRGETDLNIQGGITYLKQKLQQSGGNVEQALSRYNRGTPTYKGVGDPNYVENVLAKMEPGDLRLQAPRQPSAQAAPAGGPAALRAALPERPSLMQRLTSLVTPAQAEAAAPTAPPGVRDLSGLVTAPAGSQGAAGAMAAPAAPALGSKADYEVEVRLNPQAPAAPAAPSPATQVGLLQQQTQGRLAAERAIGSPTRPTTPPEAVSGAPAAPPGGRDLSDLITAPAAAPSPWGQAVRSAVRTASGGILGGLPALSIPAVERMTDPTQVPQTAADVGELVGQAGGSLVMPGPGTVVGGVAGAITGLTAGTLAQEGRLPTWKELATEAAWSALPEAGESALRGTFRAIGRGTQGGRLIRLDEAARRARALPEVFEAPTRQQVGQQFDAVRASGLQLDIAPIRQEVQALSPGKYADLMAEVQRIDRQNRTGGRYQALVNNLRNPGQAARVAAIPIGDLQDLRSHLRVRAEGLTSYEARQLVEDFQESVDDAIDAGIARGRVPTGMTVEDLQEARRQWARVRAHEDLSTLVERTIDVTPDLTMSSFKLKNLANSLRRNEGPLAQRINRAMDQTPGARAAFQRDIQEVSELYQTVELPLADVFGVWRWPGFAAVRQAISGVLASPTGRQLFREAIVEGRGRVSLNGFAAAVNAARRESGLQLPAIPGMEGEPSGASAPTTPPAGG